MASAPEQLEITFLPETHEYFVNGKKARISVTALIDKQISKTEWFAIDPAILKRAADRGTAVHSDVEYFIAKGTEPTTPEGQAYKAYIQQNGWTIENARTEFKLAIEHTARKNGELHSFILCGTADLMCKLNGKWIVADYKTTSVIHEEDVRWQMSLLDYMARKLNGSYINNQLFEYTPAEEMYVLHFDKQARFKPVKVEPIPDVEIERLLDAEALDEEYHATPVDIITPNQEQQLLELEKQITALKATQKVLEEKEKVLKQQMEQAFMAHPATRSVQLENITISYTPPTTRTAFNSEKFANDYPELYAQYTTQSQVKGTVKITLSKAVKEQIEAYSPRTLASVPTLPSQPRENKKKRGFFAQ